MSKKRLTKDEEYAQRMHTRHRNWDEMTAEERGRIEDAEDFKSEEENEDVSEG